MISLADNVLTRAAFWSEDRIMDGPEKLHAVHGVRENPSFSGSRALPGLRRWAEIRGVRI